ncbi:hypothetical protein [Limosilactobacillus mucosae]|uniref:hypothetical protein n=1 Tax=Limosilactobacillus mucosae TaxID=97478 RepID=UPI0022E4E7C9|nr:hypothetical protein [Limosilactobacillus mucosae]
MDRRKIDFFKEEIKNGVIKKNTIKYYPTEDREAFKQALRELKMYTVNELVKIVNNGFKDERYPITRDKLISKKTISNTLRKIETNDTKTQKIITRYVLKSDLKTNLKHTNEISKGKGRPYKTYSYYYVLCLNAIFKESSTKTIDQQIQDKLDKVLLTPKEIDNIFHKYLGNNYDKINHYDLEDLSTAIYNRQRRLKSAIPKIVDTYKEYIGLKKYLFNVNNAKDYVNALRILIKMADSHEIYDSDVVRLADQLNHKNPNSVISYAKKLAKNHLE